MKIIALVLCLSFFGINFGESKTNENNETEVREYMPYQIYVRNEREKAPLENDKCMSGVYIGEENMYSDIKSFEEKTGVINDIYISRIFPGDDFPAGSIIECYAKGRLPMLVIEKGFGSSQIDSVAKMCGSFDISMLVEIKTDDKYVYECFAELFRKYAPKTVLAYGIDSSVTEYDFPKESLVDWVAVEAKEKMSEGSIVSEYENIARQCSYFKDKTVMVNISVPNFSIEKCNYVYKEAAEEISRLYSLALEYNNIGALNYISLIEKKDNMINYNYRLTENEELISAFKSGTDSLVSDRYWSSTPYVAYVSDNSVLVSNSVIKSMDIKGKFINSGFSEINPSGFNKSERKVFVNS